MLLAACEQFLAKTEDEIQQVALETLEGHQRAIMGSMTVEVGHHYNFFSYFDFSLAYNTSDKLVTSFNPNFM